MIKSNNNENQKGKNIMVQQIVLPIKDSNVLKMVQDTLLDSFRAGRRNLHHLSSWQSHPATGE